MIEKPHTEDGVGGIQGDVVVTGVSHETPSIREGYIRRGDPVPLIICYDFNVIVFPIPDTRVVPKSIPIAGHLPALESMIMMKIKYSKSKKNKKEKGKHLCSNKYSYELPLAALGLCSSIYF